MTKKKKGKINNSVQRYHFASYLDRKGLSALSDIILRVVSFALMGACSGEFGFEEPVASLESAMKGVDSDQKINPDESCITEGAESDSHDDHVDGQQYWFFDWLKLTTYGQNIATTAVNTTRSIFKCTTGWHYSNIPHVKGNVFIGLLDDFMKVGLHGVIEKMHEPAAEAGISYGSMPNLTVYVRSPELIDEIFDKNEAKSKLSRIANNGPFSTMSRLFGESVFTLELGEEWRSQRSEVQSIFYHKSALIDNLPSMVRTTYEHMNALTTRTEQAPSGTSIVSDMFREVLVPYTMDVVGKAMLAVSNAAEKAPVLSERFAEMVGLSMNMKHAVTHSFWAMAFGRSPDDPDTFEVEVRERFRQAMNEEIFQPNEQAIMHSQNFIKTLYDQSVEKPEAGIATEEVYTRGATILLAAHETTAVLTLWCLIELSRHPEVQTRVYNEIAEVFADASPMDLINQQKANELFLRLSDEKLKLTSAVVKEVLRLYPPVPETARTVTTPFEIDVPGHGKVKFETGTYLLMSAYTLHHDPLLWVDPETFQPERFLNATKDPRGYLPFHLGLRKCPGSRFANLEAKLFLAAFVRKFDFHALNDVQPAFLGTLKTSEPAQMSISPRKEVSSR